jgi:hypothetical protein
MPFDTLTPVVRGDHTHWRCSKPINGNICDTKNPMAEKTCRVCGIDRGIRSVALASNDDMLGVLASIDTEGREMWYYSITTNGTS